MAKSLAVPIGSIRLKNPLIAAPGEHLIESEGVMRALRAGVAAVVVKSTNETQAARDQLQRAGAGPDDRLAGFAEPLAKAA